MTWPSGTVPPAVTAMRDMLSASATFIAAGGSQSTVHYPEVTLAVGVTLPACLIIQDEETRTVYASGSGALPTGRIRIEYYQNALAAVVEAAAFGIAQDIAASTTGLLIRSATAGLASDPSAGESASLADGDTFQFRVCTLTVDYGPQI